MSYSTTAIPLDLTIIKLPNVINCGGFYVTAHTREQLGSPSVCKRLANVALSLVGFVTNFGVGRSTQNALDHCLQDGITWNNGVEAGVLK